MVPSLGKVCEDIHDVVTFVLSRRVCPFIGASNPVTVTVYLAELVCGATRFSRERRTLFIEWKYEMNYANRFPIRRC